MSNRWSKQSKPTDFPFVRIHLFGSHKGFLQSALRAKISQGLTFVPELPEVETVVRQIRPQVVGRTITKVVHVSPLMLKSPRRSFTRHLEDRQLLALDRIGKWMFFRIAGDIVLVIHLGMTGRLSVEIADKPCEKHTHLQLGIDDGATELRFSDPRRFGKLLIVSQDEWHAQFGREKLGPDALQIRAKELYAGIVGRKRNLKALLLDQRTLAGLGNIYCDEVLFGSGLSPKAKGTDFTRDDAEKLCRNIRRLLRKSIKHQGTSIRDYVTAQGVPGDFQRMLKVYGRADQSCTICGSAIQLDRTIVSGRATYWCPQCQKGTETSNGI